MLKIPDMPPVAEGWLDDVVPTWTSLNAERIDSLPGKQPFEDAAICLAINLTDDEIAASPMLPNVFALMLAAESADGFELTANGNLTRETATAVREATDWLGCAFCGRCAGSRWSSAAVRMRRGRATASGARRRCSIGS